MRDLSELNMNEGGEPVERPAPSSDLIDELENHLGVALPDEYVTFLKYSNGGHPEVDSFNYQVSNEEGSSAVNRFFRLTADKEDAYGIWKRTDFLRQILGNQCVAIAETGGGDEIYLDTSTVPAAVYVIYKTSGNSTPYIAASFEEFVDSLYVDPDML